MSPLIECERLSLTRGGRLLCHGLDLRVTAGQCWGVLGLNGTGKSTLLHTLAGLTAPHAGTVRIEDRPLCSWRRRDLARVLGLMPQDSHDPFPATVLEVTLAGRHPHIGPWENEGEEDYRLARAALKAVDLGALERRDVRTLSGGERRRLALATLLTQAPQLMLLDEPVNHLDLHHQIRLLDRIRDETGRGRAVLMVLHDLNLARRFCDRVLLLFGDGHWQAGEVAEMMTSERLSELYAHPVATLATEIGPVIMPR